MSALTSACASLGNKDVDPFVPVLISAMAKPVEVPECIHKLAATTFVQAVEAPTLAMLVPLLVRGLRERQTAIKRKSAVIIDNMSKLVDNPADAAVFLPRLVPGLDAVRKEVANPECREVAERAHATLLRVGAQGQINVPSVEEKAAEAQARLLVAHMVSSFCPSESILLPMQTVLKTLQDVIAKTAAGKAIDEPVTQYIAALAFQLINIKNFDLDEWRANAIVPYLSQLTDAEAQTIAKAFLDRVIEEEEAKAAAVDQDEEDGEDLCNCEFSLAYGAQLGCFNVWDGAIYVQILSSLNL